jgi:hypothetical protein
MAGLVLRHGFTNFLSGVTLNHDLLSASQVAGITDLHHHAWPSVCFFFHAFNCLNEVTHIPEHSLLYSAHVTLIQKYPQRSIQKSADYKSGIMVPSCWHLKLTITYNVYRYPSLFMYLYHFMFIDQPSLMISWVFDSIMILCSVVEENQNCWKSLLCFI